MHLLTIIAVAVACIGKGREKERKHARSKERKRKRERRTAKLSSASVSRMPWDKADFAGGSTIRVSVDWSSPGLHHSMKKCDAGEPHRSTHMQTFDCGNDTGSDCRKA